MSDLDQSGVMMSDLDHPGLDERFFPRLRELCRKKVGENEISKETDNKNAFRFFWKYFSGSQEKMTRKKERTMKKREKQANPFFSPGRRGHRKKTCSESPLFPQHVVLIQRILQQNSKLLCFTLYQRQAFFNLEL